MLSKKKVLEENAVTKRGYLMGILSVCQIMEWSKVYLMVSQMRQKR